MSRLPGYKINLIVYWRGSGDGGLRVIGNDCELNEQIRRFGLFTENRWGLLSAGGQVQLSLHQQRRWLRTQFFALDATNKPMGVNMQCRNWDLYRTQFSWFGRTFHVRRRSQPFKLFALRDYIAMGDHSSGRWEPVLRQVDSSMGREE